MPVPPDAAPGARAGPSLLAGALGALALVRAAAAVAPGTWAWGLDGARDVPGPAAWVLLALAALLLVPAVARAAAPPCERCGDALAAPGARGVLARFAFAAAAALCVAALDDRAFFVGDFVMRLGVTRKAVDYARIFPQAMPLDTLLHESLPRMLRARLGWDVLVTERVLGALRAAALAWTGAAFARALDRRGGAAFAAAVGLAATGALGLCTGYGKGIADLCVLVALAGTAALRVARGRGGELALGFAVAAAPLVHRSGLLLLAPWALAVAWRAADRATRPLTAWRAAALALPLAGAALALPRAWTLLRGFDRAHLSPGDGAAFAAALAPAHLLAAANTALLVAPLLPVGALLALRARGPFARREAVVLAALALPALAMLLCVHPRQGLPRDWDVFAPAGAALALAATAVVSRALAGPPRIARLAPAVVLAALAPVLALLLRAHSAEGSIRYARAVIAGPPRASRADAAYLRQYVAIVLARDGHYAESADEFRSTAALAPTPSNLALWFGVATLTRDLERMREACVEWVEHDPSAPHLLTLSRIEHARGDHDAARDAARRALAATPEDTACVAWARTIGALGPEGATPP